MNLKGKVAIVTGGNSGIGLAIVLELARQGANIVIDYVVHPETAEALEREVRALGDQAIGVHADVSQVAELEKLIAAAVDAFGRVDIMVNNAGVETRTSDSRYQLRSPVRKSASSHQPEERLLRHPARREADDQARHGRPDHQHHLGA
jgi:NAD(P)-dependent dehydrogenase (short-subunit alcohol dehydrogenase family)